MLAPRTSPTLLAYLPPIHRRTVWSFTLGPEKQKTHIAIDAIDISREKLLANGSLFVGELSNEDIHAGFDVRPTEFRKLTTFDRTAMERLKLVDLK